MQLGDNLYSNIREHIEEFQFDQSVSEVFEDMINRSVPGYRTVLALSALVVERYVKEHSKVYDLGCSLGAGSIVAAQANPDIEYAVIGVDNSAAMVSKSRENIKKSAGAQITIEESDIQTFDIRSASVVLMNFTLQFIPIHQRAAMIKRIFEGLLPGGVLVLSEKIKHPNVETDKEIIDLHHAFKRSNGYSDLEISQKRTALENKLIPETMNNHIERLHHAGFHNVFPWFQCFNFTSLLAIKK